jgi:hypothetical protein
MSPKRATIRIVGGGGAPGDIRMMTLTSSSAEPCS